jgi:hypothetical protein
MSCCTTISKRKNELKAKFPKNLCIPAMIASIPGLVGGIPSVIACNINLMIGAASSA